jgi:hypothetical protein
MAPTLATLRDQVELNLMDTSNLIWSTTVLDEAIRAALAQLSRVYGELQTLKDLDAATETTFDDLDAYVLIKGAVAYALTFRSVGRYEESTPEPTLVPGFALMAEEAMAEFRSLLTLVDLRLKQTSGNTPWGDWKYTERGKF